MQNLLEIQNALRNASEQQLIGLLQNPNPTVPQWAVVAQMNTNKEMLDEQTRQQGLGQSTILEKQLETSQVNVSGMPQDAASTMGQNMASKTDTDQNTGIASVAPVATMASGGILKMGLGGDLDAQFILTDIPELGIRAGQFIKVSAETLEKLNNTLPKIMAKHGDKVASVQSYVDDGYRGLASAAREGDALIPTRVKKYIENTNPAPEVATSVEVPTTPENYGVSAGLPPAGGAMYSSPTGARGGSTDSSGLGLPTSEFSEVPLSAIPRPKGLATLGAAGDADMLDETVGVQTAPTTPSSPGIAAGTPFDATKYTPRLPEKIVKTTKTDPMQMTDTEIRNASQGLIPYDMSMAADGAQDPKPITIDSAVKPSEEVTNAQLEVFATDRVNPFAFNKAPETKKPEVFDPLKGLFMYQALADDAPTDDENYDAKTIIKRINELKTPEEKAATLTMLNNRFIDAEQKVESLEKRLQRARIAKRSGTGDYNYDVEAGVGRFGAGELADTLKKELIAAKDDFNLLYQNIGGLVPASGFGGDFATERYFGKDTVSALNKLKADDLQAEAAADVAKVTTAEPDLTAQTAGAEGYLRRQRENKELDAEAVLDAERAAGLTAGKNAFVAPSSADPTSNAALTAKLVEQMEEKDAPVSDSTRLDSYLNAAGQQGRAIGAAANYTPKLNLPSYEAQLDGEFDKRVIEMRELADGIASGEYTGNGLKIAQDRIKYLNSVMEATGGAETLFEYLDDGAKKVVQKIIAPAAVNMADFILGGGAQVALPEVLGGGVANTAATQDYLDILQRETDGKPNIPTKPSVLESNSILDAMITNDAQTKAGSAAKVDDSLGALITDGKAQIKAVPGPLLTPELNNKLAAGLETVVQDRTKEISEDGALINKMWGESKLQPGTNVESQIVNAEGLTAAEQLDADRAAGLTAGENAFVATTNQDAGGGGKDKPKGIATINPMANRASDSPSSYEQKLLDILAEREKSADQDKWLGLAEMGMRLMASSNPNMLSAIGESGLGAFGSYMGKQKAQDAEELNILGKLADMDMAQQTLQARKDIARMAANAKSQKPLMTFGQMNTQLQRDVDTAAETYEKFTDLNGEILPGVNKTEAMQAREDLQRAQTALVEHLAPAGIVPTLPYQNINNPIIDVS